MAVREKEIDELIKNLNLKPLEETTWQWTQDPLESLPTVRISGGTLDPTYGAVPNVTIGGSSISATGINVSTPVWTTNGTGTSIGTGSPGMWTASPSYTIAAPGTQINQGGKVHIQGENADLVIGDKSMKAWMEKVEERLNILTPNLDMEKEWDDLRRLGERYRKLEKKCREKADMWKKLKSMPAPDVK